MFEDLEVAHATGQHDAGSAAAETYLRDLAGTMPVPVPLRSVSCTTETCRLEVGATADAQGARMVQNFLNRASERLPQFTVQSDPLTGGTVVVLAREGTSLPDAEGGGLAN